MNFAEAENYLFSLGNEVETMKFGLENIRTLLAALGNPQNIYRKVQIAGTNGKGSVCAFLDSICTEAGIRAGFYTSPHLVSITERIRIGGEEISKDKFAQLATRVRAESEKLAAAGDLERVPTFFEQVTALALLAFADAEVELAVLETGLGGRFDATTAANAEIAAITRIDLDHQEYLGDTIEKIAAEKAAIIRTGSKVVLGAQYPGALSVLLERCRDLEIVPLAANKQYICEVDIRSGKVTTVEFDIDPPADLAVRLGLPGRHQVENAHTAVMVAGILANDFNIEISENQIKRGLELARHAGRLEFLNGILLDGAHNPGGASALATYLDEYVSQPITMIFGAMRDKNVGEIAEILWPKAAKLILTQPSNSRAMAPEELFRFVPSSVDPGRVVLIHEVEEALKAARKRSQDAIVVVTGSLYLVGEVRGLLNNGCG